MKGKGNLRKVTATDNGRAQEELPGSSEEDRGIPILLVGHSPEWEKIEKIARGFGLHDGFLMDWVNRLLWHPIRDRRKEKVGEAIEQAIRQRADESGTSYMYEFIKAGAAAYCLIIRQPDRDFHGHYYSRRAFEHELRKRMNDEVTEDLLGTDWRRKSFKKKRQGKAGDPSGCATRDRLHGTVKGDPEEKDTTPEVIEIPFEEAFHSSMATKDTDLRADSEAEALLRLERFEELKKKLSPAEKELADALHQDNDPPPKGYNLKKAAARLRISESTVRNQFASIKEKAQKKSQTT